MKVKNIHSAQEWFEVLQTTERSQTAVMVLAPGKATGPDAEAHEQSDQSLLVVTGSIMGDVGGMTLDLEAGDVIVIPAGTRHRFWNEGEQSATTFNVYSPPEYAPDARG